MRFLWKDSLKEEPSMYQFDRTVFLPLGVKAIYQYFYVDDGLPSTDSQEKAIEMRKQMTELQWRGVFCLHKCLANDPDVLATIPEHGRSP